MNLRPQRDIAARILKVGKYRVWFNPEYLERIDAALTKQDIRNLIESGVIKKKPMVGNSRVRARKIQTQKAKGLRKGRGKRKGSKNARNNTKIMWVVKIRALRKHLRKLKADGKINAEEYRNLYNMASGGFFRNKKHMNVYIEKKVKK